MSSGTESHSSSEEDSKKPENETVSADPPVKRGRGRPKKSLTVAKECGDGVGDGISDHAAKRGRGRPSLASKKEMLTSGADSPSDKEPEGGAAEKEEEEEIDGTSANASLDDEASGAPAKKEVEEGSPVIPAKRGRGRPSKASLAALGSPAPKRRGRPSNERKAKRAVAKPREHESVSLSEAPAGEQAIGALRVILDIDPGALNNLEEGNVAVRLLARQEDNNQATSGRVVHLAIGAPAI